MLCRRAAGKARIPTQTIWRCEIALLRGFPLLTQRTTITGDGKPSEDASLECVTTCILAAMMYLLGIAQMDGQWNPDAIKDAVYGQGYVGATAARNYVAYARAHGVSLWSVQGMPAKLVAEIHTQLAAGKPVLVTVPDVYVPASYGWTHVLAAYADAPGQITMLDPWPGRPITKSDAEWSALLLENEIWILEAEMIKPLTLADPAAAALFEEVDAQHWRDRQTGYILQYGLLADYIANGAISLERLGHLVSGEIVQPNGDVVQHYQYGGRMWIKATGKVVSIDLYAAGSPGVDPRLARMQAQIAQLQSQPAAPQVTSVALQAAGMLAEVTGHKLV